MTINFSQRIELPKTTLWKFVENSTWTQGRQEPIDPLAAERVLVPLGFKHSLPAEEAKELEDILVSLYKGTLPDWKLTTLFTPETLALQTRLEGKEFYRICKNIFGETCTGALPRRLNRANKHDIKKWLQESGKKFPSPQNHYYGNEIDFRFDNVEVTFNPVGKAGGNNEAFGFEMLFGEESFFFRVAKQPKSKEWLDFGLMATHFMAAGPFQNMMNPYWCDLSNGLTLAEFIRDDHEKVTQRPGQDWQTYREIIGISKGGHDESGGNNLIGSGKNGFIRVDYGGMKFSFPYVNNWSLFERLIMQNPDPRLRYRGVCNLSSIAYNNPENEEFTFNILQKLIADEACLRGLTEVQGYITQSLIERNIFRSLGLPTKEVEDLMRIIAKST